jgi:Zn-dependent M32 family carboxypeptidase
MQMRQCHLEVLQQPHVLYSRFLLALYVIVLQTPRLHAEYDGLPISDALSLGVHESQSLLWERMVALTPAFCRYLFPKIQESFPEFGKGKTPEVRALPANQQCKSRIHVLCKR